MVEKLNRPLCVAHRGGSHLAPENTLAAFRNALALQVDVVEMDVQMTRDGQLIVFHDSEIARLTDGTGNILDLDFAYLRSLNTAAHFHGGWAQREQIPTLREVLDLVKRQAKMFIELKYSERDGQHGRYPGLVEAVLEDIYAANLLDSVVLISFDWELLAQVKALAPQAQTGIIVGDEVWNPHAPGAVASLLAQAKELKSNWIDIQHDLLTPEMAQTILDSGFRLAIWTANTLEVLHRCEAMGVEALTTDRPDLCLSR
jgi:glycerophosphoryl diester phosphodiesterase